MNKAEKWSAAVTIGLMVAGGGFLWYGTGSKAGKIPKDKISGMQFPKGMKMTGDEKDGTLCHKIVFRHKDGSVETLKQHRIEGKDVRKLSEQEIKDLIIADMQADLEQEGMACLDTAPGLFPSAYADYARRCYECGSDCWVTSCPADFVAPMNDCFLNGPDCVISIICCASGGGCPASCDV